MSILDDDIDPIVMKERIDALQEQVRLLSLAVEYLGALVPPRIGWTTGLKTPSPPPEVAAKFKEFGVVWFSRTEDTPYTPANKKVREV